MRSACHRPCVWNWMADCQISLSLSGVIRLNTSAARNEIAGMVPISARRSDPEDVENVVRTAKSVRVRDEHPERS